ncbi:hypothetical protein CDAR_220461 [Caerostris darwini]|uniref:Uncharacterized protein n=1 Tax=Caerostris darwini TaxID=1538125 RepID=A0AAV4UFM5_9ARAC|nr:hypothetical protein CDAR_220461 [Caerostris darwini]
MTGSLFFRKYTRTSSFQSPIVRARFQFSPKPNLFLAKGARTHTFRTIRNLDNKYVYTIHKRGKIFFPGPENDSRRAKTLQTSPFDLLPNRIRRRSARIKRGNENYAVLIFREARIN